MEKVLLPLKSFVLGLLMSEAVDDSQTIVLSHPAQSPRNISAVRQFICVCKASDKLFVKERLALSVTVFKGTKRLLSRAMLQSMETP